MPDGKDSALQVILVEEVCCGGKVQCLESGDNVCVEERCGDGTRRALGGVPFVATSDLVFEPGSQCGNGSLVGVLLLDWS